MSNLRRAGQEATARDQIVKLSPESLQADAELQKAVLAYIAKQREDNSLALRKAVSHLQELIPWPDGEKVCPAHQRMLDLMPEDLQWPDPIWGDSLFD
jgi:hypothetical protein